MSTDGHCLTGFWWRKAYHQRVESRAAVIQAKSRTDPFCAARSRCTHLYRFWKHTLRKPFEIACPEVYIRVHFWTAPSDAVDTPYIFKPALLKIACVDTRREHKLTAGTPKNEHPCSFLGCQFAEANWLLLETTAVHGGSDTLRINLCAATK